MPTFNQLIHTGRAVSEKKAKAQQRAAALEDRLFALLAQDGQTLRFEPPMPPESVRRTKRAAQCLPGRTARGTMPWPTRRATCAAL